MLGKLKSMLGIRAARKLERPKPDLIAAELTVALQRNEAASVKARQVLEEMLARNDGLRGSKQ